MQGKTIKLRDYSQFPVVRFNDDLSKVYWDDSLSSRKNNADLLFSSFNTIVNKHAP